MPTKFTPIEPEEEFDVQKRTAELEAERDGVVKRLVPLTAYNYKPGLTVYKGPDWNSSKSVLKNVSIQQYMYSVQGDPIGKASASHNFNSIYGYCVAVELTGQLNGYSYWYHASERYGYDLMIEE